MHDTQTYELGETLASFESRNDAWQWNFKNYAAFVKVTSAECKTSDK
jgi:hypothetical protein